MRHLGKALVLVAAWLAIVPSGTAKGILGPDFVGAGDAGLNIVGAPTLWAGYGTVRLNAHNGPSWTFNAGGLLYQCDRSGGSAVARVFADPEATIPIGTGTTCGGGFTPGPLTGVASFDFVWHGYVLGLGEDLVGSMIVTPSP